MPANVVYDEDDWYLHAELPAGTAAGAFRYRAQITQDLGLSPSIRLSREFNQVRATGDGQVTVFLTRADRGLWFVPGPTDFIVDIWQVDPVTDQDLQQLVYGLLVLRRDPLRRQPQPGRSEATLAFWGPNLTGVPWDFAALIRNPLDYLPGYFDYALDSPPDPTNDWSYG